MASSASAARAPNSGSKSFDFGSDDILCSYEDFGDQDGNNGVHPDPSIANNLNKEFNKSRMARSQVYPAATYRTPEESSFNQGVICAVDNTVKKYSENVMRFLEGISSRLSQLELYCYNLDKSMGEMHSDWVRDHGESEAKLRSLEKHVQEVHRSVQILRDRQELSDAQQELAKLQLAKNASNNKQPNEDRASGPASEPKNGENSSDFPDQQLALALPNQVPPHHARPVEHQQPSVVQPSAVPQSSMPSQTMAQVQAYYLPPQQMPNIPAPSQPSQSQYLSAQSHGQDLSRMAAQPSQTQGNLNPQVQLLPSYQQQWSQPQPQPIQPPQQSVVQPQIRTSSPMMYPSYLPGQPNQSSAEMPHGSMHMQIPYGGASRPGSAGSDGITYGYGASGRPIQQQGPTQLKTGYTAQSGEGGAYIQSGPRPQLPPGSAYMVFDSESGRAHHLPPQPQFQQGAYPPTSIPQQNHPPRVPSTNALGTHQPIRGHPYNELIEKLVNMGYRGDHVLGAIQRMEESGQPVDFNAVLDRLNGHSSGSQQQRGW